AGSEAASAPGGMRRKLQSAAARLREAEALLAGLPGARSAVRALQEKAAQLEDSRFTIALFGAFSAGKSSFANALMGQRTLPVSPNPTTAAINQIVPPDENGAPGTAKVHMKSAERIQEDIEASLQALGLRVKPGIAPYEGLQQAAEVNPSHVPASGKPHLAFLKAALAGWADAEPHLGSTVTVDQEGFRAYVAEERKSCFVERIDYHHESPLSEQGIVLVDTPGADSVNARHTGVAFTYIKNADAVLFVTYYNHAFSQADRQFLEQLGRVKDAFAMDKMFFIVNAADLASSEQELDDVLRHLQDNLLKFGIRNPRMYPVSSLHALEAKLAGDEAALADSGFARFEADFFRFASTELAELAVSGAEAELGRAAALMEQWTEAAQQGEEQRQAKLEAVARSREQAKRLLAAASSSEEENAVKREAQELLYYLKQRLQYRFGDWYTDSFNPTLFPVGADVRTSLRIAYGDLTRSIRIELENELLASTLRIETFAKSLLRKQRDRLSEQLRELLQDFASGELPAEPFETADHEKLFTPPEADEKLLMSNFKNAKAFFEGEGKKKLRAELEKLLFASIEQAVEAAAERFAPHYADSYREAFGQLRDMIDSDAAEHADGLENALRMNVDMDDLLRRQTQLQSLLGE
ncbi:dynamin family protein, partial [Paenibacillus turpanensis]|uniref:dynamin family protein n=1 Tax=Paenibacillus turpanensis TaxID=2689078 RepID=UPI001A9EE594